MTNFRCRNESHGDEEVIRAETAKDAASEYAKRHATASIVTTLRLPESDPSTYYLDPPPRFQVFDAEHLRR